MPWLLPIAFIIALIIMIYAAVLAFRGEVQRPVGIILVTAAVLWLAWELRAPL